MPNYKEERSGSSPFQNGSNQQDGWASRDDRPLHIPHGQLVTHFRRFIAQEQEEENRRNGLPTSPAEIVYNRLDSESLGLLSGQQSRAEAHKFWYPLVLAWAALTYDQNNPRRLFLADSRLSTAYEATKDRREPAIQLTRYQAGIIDALADAAGVAHQKGRTAIPIPESIKAVSQDIQNGMQDVWLQMCMGERRKK